MCSDQKVFSFGIHHLLKVFLVDGYQTLVDESAKLGVIMHNRSQGV